MASPPSSLPLPAASADIAARLAAGELVVLPTDTVPGIAARLDLAQAVARLRAIKGSPPDRPFSWHLPSLRPLMDIAPSLPPGLAAWLSRVLPRGVTVLMPRGWLSLPFAWDWPLIGLRLPQHPGFFSVADICGGPLAMTSVNAAGEAPRLGLEALAWGHAHGLAVAGVEASTSPTAPSTVVQIAPEWRCLRGQLAPELGLPGRRVLILCSGNICRSPLAEAYLRQALATAWDMSPAALAATGWVIRSAGTLALSGGPASPHSVTVAAEAGIDLSSHRSLSLDQAMREPWDLVLGMGPQHLVGLPQEQPAALLDPAGHPIADPFGGGLADYRQMAAEVAAAIDARVQAWAAWPQPSSTGQ